ncbi:hypothetical protein CDL15_Pgr018623 [Punica granatum]|uniref:Uncharacterized protein n=1 Tax=Punica granatum TaxID=22663 RepID=A0A218WZB6_PUNGR|nr:hypothetical protein CDL15_Pgr018623 [Punica granatum]PKI59424.1 hypothetical protein CRG98_020183 [Punica granatum]
MKKITKGISNASKHLPFRDKTFLQEISMSTDQFKSSTNGGTVSGPFAHFATTKNQTSMFPHHSRSRFAQKKESSSSSGKKRNSKLRNPKRNGNCHLFRFGQSNRKAAAGAGGEVRVAGYRSLGVRVGKERERRRRRRLTEAVNAQNRQQRQRDEEGPERYFRRRREQRGKEETGRQAGRQTDENMGWAFINRH